MTLHPLQSSPRGIIPIPGTSVITPCHRLSLIMPPVHSFIPSAPHHQPRGCWSFTLWGLCSPNYRHHYSISRKGTCIHSVAQASDFGSSWTPSFSYLPSTKPKHPRSQPQCPGPSFPVKLQLAFVQSMPGFSLLEMAWSPKPAPRSPLLQEACPDASTYPRSNASSWPPPAQLTLLRH